MIYSFEQEMFKCVIKSKLGVECPGCGLQRSFWQLMEGNIKESISLYPALIPIILMFLFLFLHLIFNFKKGHVWILSMFIFNSTLLLLNYLFKII